MKIHPKALLIPLLWLSGFFVSFYILPIPDVIQTATVVTCAVIALAGAFVFTKTEIPLSPLTFLIMALWGLAGVSVVASDVKFVSLIYFFFFSLFPISFLIFSVTDNRKILIAVRCILLALGIASLIQFFFIPDMLKFGGTHWPFADNNSLGALLAVGTLLFFGASLKGSKTSLLASLILFAALMTTEGRAIMLAFAGSFILFLVLQRPPQKKTIGTFITGCIFLLAVMKPSDLSIWHWFGDGQKTIESFASAPADKPNRLTGSRVMMWESATQIIKSHPVTGTGIGSFFLYYPEFRSPWDDSAGYMAHNDLVQFATEMGVLAPLLALTIIGFLILKTFGQLKNMASPDNRLDILLPFSVFMMVSVHSLSNFNFYILPTLMISGLILAEWNNRTATRIITIGHNKLAREIGVVFPSIAALTVVWLLTLSEYKTGDAMTRLSAEDIAGFGQSLNDADVFGMGLNGRAYMQAAQFAVATNDKQKALTLLDKAEQANPRIPQIYIERSIILLPDNKEQSLAQAETALRIDPSSISARMQMADVLQSMGKKDEAYQILKQGLVGRMRSPNPQPYYQRLAIDAMSIGDFETQNIVLSRLKSLAKKHQGAGL